MILNVFFSFFFSILCLNISIFHLNLSSKCMDLKM
jgi:hypothetical protein